LVLDKGCEIRLRIHALAAASVQYCCIIGVCCDRGSSLMVREGYRIETPVDDPGRRE
jgi:hypothetical protein